MVNISFYYVYYQIHLKILSKFTGCYYFHLNVIIQIHIHLFVVCVSVVCVSECVFEHATNLQLVGISFPSKQNF